MAAVQHVYMGQGDPNGVITDAAVGSHYIDELTYATWHAVFVEPGFVGWNLLMQGTVGVANDAPQTTRTFAAGYTGSEIFGAEVELKFEGEGATFSNVEMQMLSNVPTFVTAGESLVEVRPLRSGGRLVMVTPVSQPINPI